MKCCLPEDPETQNYRIFDRQTGELIRFVRGFSTHLPGTIILLRTENGWPVDASLASPRFFVEDEVQREFWVVDTSLETPMVVGVVGSDCLTPFPAIVTGAGDSKRLDVPAAEAALKGPRVAA